MTLNYPNGKPYSGSEQNDSKKKETTRKKKQRVNYGKRGMNLEDILNRSNQFYLQKKIAVIHKKPTPIQVVKVDYPKRSAAVIREAYYRQSSTTDFNGVYKGYYLDFEAKETQNEKSFPLKNFHEHQIQHMSQCLEQDGLAFVIIQFTSLHRVFLLEHIHLNTFWKNQKEKAGRKSIPLKYIEEYGIEIGYGFNPPLDYLKAVDQLIHQYPK